MNNLNEKSLEQLITAMRDTKHGAIPSNLIWTTAPMNPNTWSVTKLEGKHPYEVEVNFD